MRLLNIKKIKKLTFYSTVLSLAVFLYTYNDCNVLGKLEINFVFSTILYKNGGKRVWNRIYFTDH